MKESDLLEMFKYTEGELWTDIGAYSDKKNIKGYNTTIKGVEAHYKDGIMKGLEIASGMRQQMQGEGWISVKDRLPENPEEYLVFGGQYVTTLEWTGDNWFSDMIPMKYFDQKNVTHWMPLPEPPTK